MTESDLQWLRSELDRCRQWIQAALDRDIGTHTIDDVWELIERGVAQLWPCENAAMVTVYEPYPRKTILRGWLAGGDLQEILDSVPRIEAWSLKSGCSGILVHGRDGWLRKFTGYSKAGTSIYKEL